MLNFEAQFELLRVAIAKGDSKYPSCNIQDIQVVMVLLRRYVRVPWCVMLKINVIMFTHPLEF